MSIKVPVVNTVYDVPANSTHGIHTFVEGVRHPIGAVYSEINGQMKKIWPEQNPVTDPTVEYKTAGTYTLTLAPGYYKFTISGAGGGSALAYRPTSEANHGGAVAGGGSGAYGYFELQLNVQETFTFVLGSGGTGRNGKGTSYGARLAGDAGTVTTISSNLRGTFVTLNAGGGGWAWWDDDRGGHHDQAAGAGGTYSTTLTSHHFNNGSAGSSAASNATTKDWYGYGGNNPAPYQGDGGTAHFYGPADMSNRYSNPGQAGYLKIEPAVQYIYTSPITTSVTLDPGTYYFEIVGGGGGGLGVTGASNYAYGNGGAAASGYGYFTVNTQGVYNIKVGSAGAGNSSSAGVTSKGTHTSGNGSESYIKRASDNFNIVTCGGGTGVSWHYDGSQSGGEYFNYFGQGGTYSTSLSGNYTLANGANGTGTYSGGDYQYNFPQNPPVYFNTFGLGGFGRRLYQSGATHEGGNGVSGMVKIYKYA